MIKTIAQDGYSPTAGEMVQLHKEYRATGYHLYKRKREWVAIHFEGLPSFCDDNINRLSRLVTGYELDREARGQ